MRVSCFDLAHCCFSCVDLERLCFRLRAVLPSTSTCMNPYEKIYYRVRMFTDFSSVSSWDRHAYHLGVHIFIFVNIWSIPKAEKPIFAKPIHWNSWCLNCLKCAYAALLVLVAIFIGNSSIFAWNLKSLLTWFSYLHLGHCQLETSSLVPVPERSDTSVSLVLVLRFFLSIGTSSPEMPLADLVFVIFQTAPS